MKKLNWTKKNNKTITPVFKKTIKTEKKSQKKIKLH